MANEAVRHLKDAEFRAFLAEKNVALVDFWASWCGPCRMVAPTIEQLAQEYEGRANVGKVNVDEEGGLAGDFGVMSIPRWCCSRTARKWSAWWACVRSRTIRRSSTRIYKRVSGHPLRSGSAAVPQRGMASDFALAAERR